MKSYNKPQIISANKYSGIVPLAAAAAGMSAAEIASLSVGAAALVGAAMGLAGDRDLSAGNGRTLHQQIIV